MARIDLEIKFSINETVYLITDEEQLPRILTALTIRDGAYVTYELSQGTETSWHVAAEISLEENRNYFLTKRVMN